MFKTTIQHYAGLRKIYSLLIACICLTLITSCKDGFDDYWKYEAEQDGALYTKLKENAQFSLFVRAIERAGLQTTLDRAGVYTIFAPTDAAMQTYLTGKGTTIEQVSVADLTEIVNYHIMYFTYYHYDFQRRFIASSSNVSYLNRSYKYLRVTTDKITSEVSGREWGNSWG